MKEQNNRFVGDFGSSISNVDRSMAAAKKYLSQSWTDPRIDVRVSDIGGRGMFAREPIREGDR